jgi:hypothetical protein
LVCAWTHGAPIRCFIRFFDILEPSHQVTQPNNVSPSSPSRVLRSEAKPTYTKDPQMLLANLWSTYVFIKGLMDSLSVPLRQYEQADRVFARPAPSSTPLPGLPVQNPTRSFWLDSAPDCNPLAREGSTGELTQAADVCIIGSGITGVSVAYHLANALSKLNPDKPTSAVVLEARDFCTSYYTYHALLSVLMRASLYLPGSGASGLSGFLSDFWYL